MSNICEATLIKSLFWTPMDSTNYWKCVLHLPPTWLANWPWLFEQANHALYLISWYTGRDPEQEFWRCFMDRMLDVWFCRWCRQWIQPHESWSKAKWENNDRGGEEKNFLTAFFDFFLSPPPQSFSHST